jgi:predicted ribosomally synthesized peptide with nif11-like leader
VPLSAKTSGRAEIKEVAEMADVARAEALVDAMEQDPAFRKEVEAAPTMAAKRSILDDHGWQDVTLEDMRAYVEGQGGQLILKTTDRELSDDELDAVVGGDSLGEIIGGSVGGVVAAGAMAAALGAAY